MTITSTHYLEPVYLDAPSLRNVAPKPPSRVWQAAEPPFKGYQSPRAEEYEHSSANTAIVIDNGLSSDLFNWQNRFIFQ